MSDGIAFKANHANAPVTVEIRVGWAETATEDQIVETLAMVYAEASHRAIQRKTGRPRGVQLMADARHHITQVMREHRRGTALYGDDRGGYYYRCSCGWRIHVTDDTPTHTEHLAAEIDTALGGLTPEWAAVDNEGHYFGSSPNSREAAQEDADNYDGMTVHYRWVSGWTPEAVG